MKNKLSDLNWFQLLLIAFSASVINITFVQISLYILLPIVFILTWYQNSNNLLPNKSLKLYLSLVLWFSLSSIVAYDSQVAFKAMIRIFSAFLCSLALYHLASNKINVIYLYIIMVISFCMMIYYAYMHIGLYIATAIQDRLQDDLVNANSFAYSYFYASFAIFLIVSYFLRHKYIVQLAVLIILLGISVWLSLMTASRQVILIQIPFLLMLFFVGKTKINRNNVLIIIVLLLSLPILYPKFESFFTGSLLASRSEVSITEDSRYVILLEAIKVGFANPIFGVGPSNFALVNKFHIFSHNNFSEILACGGIPALLLYISLVFSNLLKQWKRYRITKDSFFLYHFYFQLFFIIDNFLYVQIMSLWLMAFYFVSVGHSDSHYKYLINMYYDDFKINQKY